MGDGLKARKPDSFSPGWHMRQNRLAQCLAGLIVQGKRADAGSLFEPALHPARQGGQYPADGRFQLLPVP